MKKIYIVGCAKTGTTLMRRLFNAFDDLYVCNDKEISLRTFIDSEYNVGKRTFHDLFSNCISSKEEKEAIIDMVLNDISIVLMKRNKEDILKSSNGYVSEDRYNCVQEQIKRWKKFIDCVVEYETLISNPDEVQKYLANSLDLKIKHKFSEYPSFMKDDKVPGENYKLRPIGEGYS
jgi:hypothetical protein